MRGRKFMSSLLAAAMVFSMMPAADMADVQAADDSVTLVSDEDLTDGEVTEPEAWGATPNEEQLWYMKQGLAAFCHFGPNTYNGIEWGENYGTRLPSEIFGLEKDFDAETIVKAVKDAGFSRLMITAKHHDGFCLWASELTDYDISSTDYKNGEGDILAELSAACTKYNVDMGLYLSPWDIHEDKYGCFGDTNNTENFAGYTDYSQLYIDSIKEICTATNEDGSYKYGNNNPDRRSDRFVEWWMDGAQGGNSHHQTFDWTGIFEAIRETNPHCQIFGTHAAGNGSNENDPKIASTGGVHWIGNEEGYASVNTWAKVYSGQNYEAQNANSKIPEDNGKKSIQGRVDGDQWSVPEVDTKMLNSGWFWSASKQASLHSLESLANIYFNSVGHGATLLLNLSPNTDGTIDENQLARFQEFGQTIKDTFAEDLTKAEGVSAKATSVWENSRSFSPDNVLDKIPEDQVYDETYWAPAEGETTGSLEINLGGLKTFDVVSIEEYIQKGQAISSFSVEYKTVSGEWKEFATGYTVSSKRLCRNEPVEGLAIRINILSAESTPMISNVGVYKAAEGFSLGGEGSVKLPTNLKEVTPADDCFVRSGSWTNSSDGTHVWTGKNSADTYAEITFTGTKAWIKGILDPGHGTAAVFIDGEEAGTIDFHADSRAEGQIVYETPELSYGEHVIKLVADNEPIDMYGAYYHDGSGVFEMKEPEYWVNEGQSAEVEIVRTLGSHGEVTINYATPSAGAEQGVNYQFLDGSVTFAEGETSKKITVTALNNERGSEGMDFYFSISSDTASMGTQNYSRVKIHTRKTVALGDLQNFVMQQESIIQAGQGKYTDASWKAFQNAYEAAKKVTAESTLAEIQRIQQALESAAAGLQVQTETQVSDKTDPEPKPEPKPEAPKVGTILKDAKGTASCKVTGANTVTFQKPTKKTNKKFTVPAEITANGITYKVTAIADKAFQGNKKLTQVVIGKNVKTIGKSAFEKCSRLKTISVKGTAVKKVGKNALKGIHAKCKIKVPKKKLNAYKKIFKGKGQKKTVKITK